MTHEEKLLTAAKAVLDADTTLKSLLLQKGTSSKIILGQGRPGMAQNPTIQLFIAGHDTHPYSRLDTLQMVAAVFTAAKVDKSADEKQSADISERVMDLLIMDNPGVATRLAVAGHRHHQTFMTGQSPIRPSAEVPVEDRTEYVQEVNFAVSIIRTTGS